jgi:4-hydroxy-tetrahydrodipicolinate synthase
VELYEAASNQDIEAGIRAHEEILEMEEMMNLETIPIAVKAALDIKGVHDATVRPPLYEASDETRATLQAFLETRSG